MSLQLTIDQDIKAAMLAKDSDKLRALRAVKSALMLANTEKGAAGTINEEAEIKVLQKLVKQRTESAEIYQQQNRTDLYQIEMDEKAVIEAYLPKQLERAEVEAIVRQVIAETGASTIKDMGRVMGAANKSLAGKADGKTIADVVKSLLAG